MHKYYRAGILLLGLLTVLSCGQAPEPVNDKIPERLALQLPIKIPTTDMLGQFAGDVHDLAFWSHATRPYQGGLFATNGEAGLVFITIEGAAWTPVAGQFSGDVDVTYLADAAPQSDSIIAGFDAATGDIRHFQMDLENRRLLPVKTQGLPPNPAYAGFCFGADVMSEKRWLMTFTQSGQVDIFTIMRNNAGGLQFSLVAKLDVAGIRTCTQDPRSRQFFMATKTGAIVTVDATQDAQEWHVDAFTQLLHSGEPIILVDMGLTFRQGGQGELILLTQAPEKVIALVVDLGTAKLLGQFIFDAFDTISAVKTARAFAVGSGNFGGLYRSGVVGVIDPLDNGALKLAPLISVARQLALVFDKTLSLRKVLQQRLRVEATESFRFDIQMRPADLEYMPSNQLENE